MDSEIGGFWFGFDVANIAFDVFFIMILELEN
jgi:hypothetical protein